MQEAMVSKEMSKIYQKTEITIDLEEKKQAKYAKPQASKKTRKKL